MNSHGTRSAICVQYSLCFLLNIVTLEDVASNKPNVHQETGSEVKHLAYIGQVIEEWLRSWLRDLKPVIRGHSFWSLIYPGIMWRSLTIKARIEAQILPKIRLRSWVPHKSQIKPMIQTKENHWKPSTPFTNTGNFLWARPFTPIFAS